MARMPQDNLETLLTQHLTATLEPQRGRAAVAFRRHLEVGSAGDDAPASLPLSRGVIPRRALWYWAGVPSLVAAGLAVVVTLQTPGTRHTEKSSPANAGTITFDAPALDQYELSRDINAGVAELNGDPVRVIRHQEMRHAQWVDPSDRATYGITEQPVERVGYLKVQPY
jgi:hypothetical protein